jgi:hypothetical protein
MQCYDSGILLQDEGLSLGVREALADPIVQALLIADRVDPRDVADLSRRMASWLSRRAAVAASEPTPGFHWGAFEYCEHALVCPEQGTDG